MTGEISDFYAELIEKCWKHDPSERPSFDEEYQKYITMIEKSQISYDQTKTFHEFDKIIEEKECSQKVGNLVNNSSFDLKKFVQCDVIDDFLFNDVCLIDNKETGERYSARVSKLRNFKFLSE